MFFLVLFSSRAAPEKGNAACGCVRLFYQLFCSEMWSHVEFAFSIIREIEERIHTHLVVRCQITQRRMKIMILPKLALSVMSDSLESIARFADAETLQQIVNRMDLYLHDAEGSLLDYETCDIVEKRNEIFKAVLEYTKAVVERELSNEKDGHECGR